MGGERRGAERQQLSLAVILLCVYVQHVWSIYSTTTHHNTQHYIRLSLAYLIDRSSRAVDHLGIDELVTKDSCDLKFMTVASHMSCRVSVVVTHVRGGTAFQKHLDGARVAKGGRAEEGLHEGRGEGGDRRGR